MAKGMCTAHEGPWLGGDDTTCPTCIEIARLTRERDALRALLQEREWSGVSEWFSCQFCKGWDNYCQTCDRCKSCGHTHDCALAAAIKEDTDGV